MKTGEIIKDSIRYPLSNWTSYLILGILTFFSGLYNDVPNLITHYTILIVLVIITILVTILENGYVIKIFKSSLVGLNTAPNFNEWKIMFKDGFKAIIVAIIYSIPLLIIIVVTIVVLTFLGFTTLLPALIITAAYLILVSPVIYLGLVNMAKNESKIESAFELHEIFQIISNAGWGKLIALYITTMILAVIFGFITVGINFILSILSADVITSLLLIPYISLFMARIVVLFYMSEDSELEEISDNV